MDNLEPDSLEYLAKPQAITGFMSDSPVMNFIVKGTLKVIGITAFYAENARNLLSLTQLEDSGFTVSANKVDNITKGYIVKNGKISIYFIRRRGVFPLLQLKVHTQNKQNLQTINIATRKKIYDTNSIKNTSKLEELKFSTPVPAENSTIMVNNNEPPMEQFFPPVENTKASSFIETNDSIEDFQEPTIDLSENKSTYIISNSDSEHVLLTNKNKIFTTPSHPSLENSLKRPLRDNFKNQKEGDVTEPQNSMSADTGFNPTPENFENSGNLTKRQRSNAEKIYKLHQALGHISFQSLKRCISSGSIVDSDLTVTDISMDENVIKQCPGCALNKIKTPLQPAISRSNVARAVGQRW
jgi:hypothetical protein